MDRVFTFYHPQGTFLKRYFELKHLTRSEGVYMLRESIGVGGEGGGEGCYFKNHSIINHYQVVVHVCIVDLHTQVTWW